MTETFVDKEIALEDSATNEIAVPFPQTQNETQNEEVIANNNGKSRRVLKRDFLKWANKKNTTSNIRSTPCADFVAKNKRVLFAILDDGYPASKLCRYLKEECGVNFNPVTIMSNIKKLREAAA